MPESFTSGTTMTSLLTRQMLFLGNKKELLASLIKITPHKIPTQVIFACNPGLSRPAKTQLRRVSYSASLPKHSSGHHLPPAI